MKEIARRVPIDRTAARVTQAGPKGLESAKTIAQTHSDTPLPTYRVPSGIKDLTGKAVGSLTVIGLAKPTETKQEQVGNHRLWVCRCVCGRYLTRRAKAINNPKNTQDCCDHCRHVLFLRRRATYQALGFNPDECSGETE